MYIYKQSIVFQLKILFFNNVFNIYFLRIWYLQGLCQVLGYNDEKKSIFIYRVVYGFIVQ